MSQSRFIAGTAAGDPCRTDQVARADSETRFRMLYQHHVAAVAAYAARRVPAHEAPDVVSETFLVLWRRFDERPENNMIRPWLYGISRRVIANRRRGSQRRSNLLEHLRAQPVKQPMPQQHQTDAELAVLDAMAQLTEPHREVLVLAGWEELTPTEIAVVLELTPQAVRKRLARARTHLAELMATSDEHEPTHSRPEGDAS